MKRRIEAADTVVIVDDQAWVFEGPAGERLELRHRETDEGLLLVVTDGAAPRSYFFHDLQALTRFQSDMESFLLATGWKFMVFSPDRRSGRDRRQWPRLSERRRWWTDNPTKGDYSPSRRRSRRS